MSYFEKNLLPDEQILYRTKKHFIIFFIPVIWTMITFFFSINSNPFIVTLYWVPGLIAILAWANMGLNYLTSDFAVTNKRVMMKEGFFIRHANEMRLSTIANVAINQSLLGQLLNYGTVELNGFGGVIDAFTLINRPLEFQKQVQMQLDKITK